jgi:hypothetical protein
MLKWRGVSPKLVGRLWVKSENMIDFQLLKGLRREPIEGWFWGPLKGFFSFLPEQLPR